MGILTYHLVKLILITIVAYIEGWKPITYKTYMSSLLGEKMGITANRKASLITPNI